MALRIVTSRLARATAQAAPGFYAGAARHMSQETDIVKDVFVEQQKKFRALLDATKDLEIPTSWIDLEWSPGCKTCDRIKRFIFLG